MRILQILSAAAFTSLVAVGCDSTTGPNDIPVSPSEMASPADASAASEIVPGRYIVVLEDGAELPTTHAGIAKVAREHSVHVKHIYTSTIRGFAGVMSGEAAARLAADPSVRYVEPDRRVTLAIQGSGNGKGNGGQKQTTPWGVTRIGGAGDGTGKVAWILDTGIDLDHPDLRVDATRSRNFAYGESTADDGNGHGTHVAGTIAARNNRSGVIGVAADATVVSVRVLNSQGAGYYSDIIAGLNYVAANGAAGDVANLSLGGPASIALDEAVVALAATGVRVVVAAGNSGVDCAATSPARVDATNVYTISATNTSNCLTLFSNYGLAVDYAAPGEGINSLWMGGGTRTISGTSMATPHVAGILLLGSVSSSGTACSDRDAVADPLAHR